MGRALLVLESLTDRQKAISWINKAPVGTRVEFKASKRSLPQNDRLWAMLTDVREHMKRKGLDYTTDQFKVIFLHAWGKEIEFLPGLDGKTFVPYGQSSSDLSKEEMTSFIEFIMAWGAENGVTFHDPNNEASDARSPAAVSDVSEAGPSPALLDEPAGDAPHSAPAGSAIPEKELTTLRRFAKDTLALAAKPDTSGELMTKVVNRWINIELINVTSDAGRAAVKSIHGSVKAIMKGEASYEAAVAFHAEGLECEPADLMTEGADHG